jgi:hypothetical protein
MGISADVLRCLFGFGCRVSLVIHWSNPVTEDSVDSDLGDRVGAAGLEPWTR